MDQNNTLFEKFISGDTYAFTQIYNSYFDNLSAYGMGLGCDKEDLKDAMQDVFSKLYLDKEKLTNIRQIHFYLLRSLKNHIINILKSKHKLTKLDDYNINFHTNINILDNIIIEEEREIIKKRIEEYLNCLTNRQREVVFLRFIEGLEYEEISQLLNIAPTSVRNQVALAIKKIRDMNMTLIVLFMLSEFHNK